MVVVIVVLAVLNPFFAAPAHITADKYIEVSQKDREIESKFVRLTGITDTLEDMWTMEDREVVELV